MRNCSNCGSNNLIVLEWGGYGGRGGIVGCENCKSVFLQTSGGFMPTPDGEKYERQSYTLEEYREREKGGSGDGGKKKPSSRFDLFSKEEIYLLTRLFSYLAFIRTTEPSAFDQDQTYKLMLMEGEIIQAYRRYNEQKRG